jgi:hypothetical protein
VTLLDLSAAFDTVDHTILIQRLTLDFGMPVSVVSWISSYLTQRTQRIKCAGVLSTAHSMDCGVPQGSVLGPLLFILYTSGLQNLIQARGMKNHFYADDSQIYASCKSYDSSVLKASMIDCIKDVSGWMSSNRLKLNPTKSEFMWCVAERQHPPSDIGPFVIDGVSIDTSKSLKILGLSIDCDLTLTTHINRTVSSCFYQLRRLKSIRRSLPLAAAKTLVNAFVVSRIDYCNGVLAGITQRQCDRMQSILNASAKLIFGGSRFDHVTPLLRDKLHWLRFRQRIKFKLCMMVYKSMHHAAPAYITELVVPISHSESARRLRSSSSNKVVQRYSKKKLGERGFSVFGPSTWNSLPDDVRMSDSINTFSSKLKSILFKECFL